MVVRGAAATRVDSREGKRRRVDTGNPQQLRDHVHAAAPRRSGLRVQFRAGEREISLRELHAWVAAIPREDFVAGLGEAFSRYETLTDVVFITALPVLPVIGRTPTNSNGTWRPHSLTLLYGAVLKKNDQLRTALDQRMHSALVDEYVCELQDAVNVLFDSRNTTRALRPRVAEAGGLRQLVDGKQGRIRGNLMGKRVEFCARTVLSGDPVLGLNEVGLPRSCCENLTVPVVVNDLNRDALGRWRIRYIRKRSGQRFYADALPRQQLLAMVEVGDIVERSLVDGDVVAVNRQPSLHRASMVAMFVRIFDCDTIRMNYSGMSGLAGDCDGDELNIHVPQDEASRAELQELMLMSTNIVSSQGSRPLLGLTQDSLLGAYLLSRAHLEPRDFWDIAYKAGLSCSPAAEAAAAPVLLKPRAQHAGFQLLDLVFFELGINLGDFARAGVVLREGRVVQAVLSKASLGIADGGLVHEVFLRHGHSVAARFMHLVQRCADHFLDQRGFSVGIGDCIVEHAPLDAEGLDKLIRSDFEQGRLPDEPALCEALNAITQLPPPECGDNRLLDMITAGSKGSVINFNQITRSVGQQFSALGRLEPELAHNTRTLPHFSKFDPGLDARGFVLNSFVQGLTPTQFWNHAKPSRITMIDTACKTSETGAQQRRLVKSLEKAIVCDGGDGKRMVRNVVDGSVIQFDYGEDNLDATYMHTLTAEAAAADEGTGPEVVSAAARAAI
ncbi:DNA-directed RNA polymerase subunit [Hondaea fermentalgiana]|uniref:DNA-directed RNA polymerase subunit n=1 Tax=Hondaea fermentalgiana TaxID=2315210 RepID=A0A2R5GPJ7_9STRA|nr:DNA-directed RNA polymerase subunit [Hondaea fermentalgiana]|eukprot:GBG32790.1 DNA-directed RNA polymerase subunit [Hondaea fermentalgiana]